MPYIPLHFICPRIAEEETRAITLFQNDNELNLPPGNYFFVELFCDECDCRRVFFQVYLNRKIVATIAYGWEKLSYYRKEFKGFSEEDIKELKGPALDPFQYQSNLSDGVLKMFYKILISDEQYLQRVEKHYNQFKKSLKTRSE